MTTNPQTTSIARIDPRQAALKKYLTSDGVKAAMNSILPRLAAQVGTTADRIIGAALVACSKEPKLLACSPDSLLRALLECAQLGLTPGGITGEAYLIPYGGEVQLQIGVRGFQRLAFDAGRVTKIEGRAVYKADAFALSYEPIFTLTHTPSLAADRGPIIAGYARFAMRDEAAQYEVLLASDIAKIRAQADAKKPSPAWRAWEDQMVIKSAIKRGAKRIDLSPTSPLARAVRLDNAAEIGDPQVDLQAIELPTIPEEVRLEVTGAQAEEATREQQALEVARGEATQEALTSLAERRR